jgi:hypothetical protein
VSSALYLARASEEETVFCTRLLVVGDFRLRSYKGRRRGLEESHILRRMHMGDKKGRADVGHTPVRRKEVFYIYIVGV